MDYFPHHLKWMLSQYVLLVLEFRGPNYCEGSLDRLCVERQRDRGREGGERRRENVVKTLWGFPFRLFDEIQQINLIDLVCLNVVGMLMNLASLLSFRGFKIRPNLALQGHYFWAARPMHIIIIIIITNNSNNNKIIVNCYFIFKCIISMLKKVSVESWN